MSGQPISPTSRSGEGFSTWWRSSTGRVGRCWRGGCRTRWRLGSAWQRWRRRSPGLASRRSSTPTRAASSPSGDFTGMLATAGIRISMDGRGRWIDNVFIERLWRSLKYEDIYLKGYADGREARAGIASWMAFYNLQRPHQALANRTPMAAWRAGTAGTFDGQAV